MSAQHGEVVRQAPERRLWNDFRLFVNAGFEAGYSAETARSVGHENLTIPDIKAAFKVRRLVVKCCGSESLSRGADRLTFVDIQRRPTGGFSGRFTAEISGHSPYTP